jgi:hypothetical protein
MEEPGEQCTVVFALTVTEPAGRWRGVWQQPPPPTSRFRNNLCKDDSAVFLLGIHITGRGARGGRQYGLVIALATIQK